MPIRTDDSFSTDQRAAPIVVKATIKPRKGRSQPAQAVRGDIGTPEIRKRMSVVLEPRAHTSTGYVTEVGARIRDQTPLDRYFSRRELSPDADRNKLLWQAGERLRSDFYDSGRGPKVSSTLKPRLFCGGGYASADDMAVRKETAERRFKNAMNEMGQGPLGEAARSILMHVCLLEGTTAEWALAHGKDKRGGMLMLQTVLTELAFKYGMIKHFDRGVSGS